MLGAAPAADTRRIWFGLRVGSDSTGSGYGQLLSLNPRQARAVGEGLNAWVLPLAKAPGRTRAAQSELASMGGCRAEELEGAPTWIGSIGGLPVGRPA